MTIQLTSELGKPAVTPVVAALFVLADGPYAIPGVDVWDKRRDARRYAGPYPVVAHPPCERWGAYWSGGPSAPRRLQLGDDGGCFAAALDCVRIYGGVLEHPKRSHAWAHFGIRKPLAEGWVDAGDDYGGITCEVDQGHYGHTARKPTWLYSTGQPEPLIWGTSEPPYRKPLPGNKRGRGNLEMLSKRQRQLTPEPFRDLLICLALGASHAR